MLQERLLERLRRTEEDPEHRGVVDPNQVAASIMNHLQKILNTRQGSALIDEGYGVPDFTDLASSFSSETVRELVKAIKEVIHKYEPRLNSVKIEVNPSGKDALELHFKLEGKLRVDDHREMDVSFETTVDPDGRISVYR